MTLFPLRTGAPVVSEQVLRRALKWRRRKQWLPIVALFTGVALMGAIQEGRSGGDVIWAGSYAAGLRQARRAGQPILLNFHTPECSWCAKMDVETFTDPQVVATLRAFTCLRADTDSDPDLIQRYHIQAFPTLLILKPNGAVRATLTGFQSPADLLPVLRAALHQR